jgi:tetratricopeptide (TPR) repeat protein
MIWSEEIIMTASEAKEIIVEFNECSVHDEQEEFMYTEALKFLIDTTGDSRYMAELGGYYYEIRCFDLAQKYYEQAAEKGNVFAYSGLGYIWYYGRTGERDYEKAFHYYSLAAENGDIQSEYKLADMYKNGYGVEKNYEKYAEIVRRLYTKTEHSDNVFEPLPEIFTRYAGILVKEGETDKALEIYRRAKPFLAKRIEYNPFFGNLNIMMWLIDDIYGLTEFDRENFDFFDLYYLLKEPCKVSFVFGKRHKIPLEVESFSDGDICAVKFGEQLFKGREDFFGKAQFDGELLTALQSDFYDFRVVS